MKNQYVGDINDYRKYGLIRALCNGDAERLRVGIFWMLTGDDERNDGSLLNYLAEPVIWQQHDPILFGKLQDIVHTHKKRNVEIIAQLEIIPNAKFCSALIPDNVALREQIFADCINDFSEQHLIFFDPDNGIEIKSKPAGRKDSNKFLYLREVADAFRREHNVLIYQHFPRIARDRYIAERAERLRQHTGCKVIFSFSTSFVCFFLLAQPDRVDYFGRRIETVQKNWGHQFEIGIHQS